MNYADIVRAKYPNYVLTKIGTGNTYNELQWSAFNPEPNPIPKATLDADLAEMLATGLTYPSGDVTPEQMVELVALSQLPVATSGLVKKVAPGTYKIDQSAYLTDIDSTHVVAALGYTPYDSSNPHQYATKTYVDNLQAGIQWITPVHAFNFVGTATAPPVTATANENYIISAGGNTGAWASFNVGDRVSYVNNQWVLREAAHIGCRLGICFDKTTTGIGDALGKDNYIGEIVGGDAINGWVWEWTAPTDRMATFNNLTSSVKFGEAYTYVSANSSWVPFASNTGVKDGEGLIYTTGGTLNVNLNGGLTIYNDKVTVDIYPNSGLMLTTDGQNSSISDSAKLSLTQVGSAGTYTKVTTDSYGRVTSGSNPTTLAGYNILDAQPLDNDLTAIASLVGTAGLLKKTNIDTWELDTNTYITGNQPITVSGDATGTGTTSIALTLANTGVAAGTYNNSATSNTPLTFDSKGRLVSKGTEVTITPLVSSLQQSGATTGQIIQWNGTQWAPTTVAGASNTLDSLTDVTITNPAAGQTLYYNGSQWINFGQQGGTSGGSAAKRIWSSNIPASSGTTVLTPSTTVPLVTDGTQLWSVTLTPLSNTTTYVIQTSVSAAASQNGANLTLLLFRNNTYLGATVQIANSSNNSATLTINLTDIPATTSPVTYQVRVATSTGTWYVNRRTSEITYGGMNNGWVIWEY